MRCNKILKFFLSKDIFKKIKSSQWKKLLSIHITHKGLVFRIGKCTYLNKKQTQPNRILDMRLEWTSHKIANNIKKFLIPLVIRLMPRKTIMRYHYIPTRGAKATKTDIAKCWRCGTSKLSMHCW